MNALDGPRTYRPVINGLRGAVASNHPLSTQAGLLTLQRGGNAVDAAVAVASCLGVVEPMASGAAGDGFYHLYRKADSKAVVFNATGPAPRAATVERYGGRIPASGPLAGSVPGSVDGWYQMHRRFGTLPWKDVLQAAIYYAREGFGATRHYASWAKDALNDLLADPGCRRIFLPRGYLPQKGDLIRQTDLARTLELLAEGGADAFYRGPIARGLARAWQADGGLVTEEDLAAFHCEEQAPIASTYRDYTLTTSPPNSVGWVLLQELNIVEQFDLASMGPLSADTIHTLVEAKRLAFADREEWGGDPRHFDIPLRKLLDKDYARSRAALLDPRRASGVRASGIAREHDTTYFCVVDGQGNAVSGIQSINSAFGSRYVAGSTGLLINNRMTPWHTERGHINELVPGRRVKHTMNTPMVFKGGELWAVFGTPGGDNQVQVNLQVITAMIDFGYDPQQAVEMPRWKNDQPGQEASWPHTGSDDLSVEDRVPEAVRAELARRGHNVQVRGALEGPCSVEAIRRIPETGMLMAGADPRRDGWALAW